MEIKFKKRGNKLPHAFPFRKKRGQVIILIALALIMLLFISYGIYTTFPNNGGIQKRVKTMDNYLFSMKQDLERNLYVSGFRTIFLAQTEIDNSGNYIGDFQSFFNESIYNGTVSGESKEIMIGATINDIINSLNSSASKMSLNLIISNVKISVGQDNPWNVFVEMNFTLNLSDKGGLASWYNNENIKSEISVESFEDPIYLVETSGRVTRQINKTIYEGNYASGSDVSNLLNHLEKGYYAANSDAPSFINRLEGNLTANENGIESFVYAPDLSNQGISVKDKSVVDHIYFSSDNPSTLQVSGMPSWFKIDSMHESKYNVTSLVI